MGHHARVLLAGLVLVGAPVDLSALCTSSGAAATIEGIVRRIERDEIKFVFVGERHGAGPIKRFIVDLANNLVDHGHDVGLYVEGFRHGCEPGAAGCGGLADLFNAEAFSVLLSESRAPVHPLDPTEKDLRTARMAAAIAAGKEALRIVLVGKSHVVSAWKDGAEYWIYGGGVRYPNPGDLVEAFSPDETLTVALETGAEESAPYTLRMDGCIADFRVVAPSRAAY